MRLLLFLCFILKAITGHAQDEYDRLKVQYDSLMAVGNEEAALPVTKAMNRWALENESDTSLRYAVSFRYIGNCFENNDSALKYYEFSKKNLEKQNRTIHPDYSRCLNNFGLRYFKINNLNSAISNYKKAIEIIEKTNGQNNQDYLLSTSNLADLYFQTSEFENAKYLFLKVATIRKNIDGESSTYYASDLRYIGLCNYNLKYFNEAEIYLKSALNIIEKFSKSDPFRYQLTLADLGDFYFNTGRYREAIPYYQTVLSHYQTVLSPLLSNYTNDEYTAFYTALIHLYLGIIYNNLKLYNQAIDNLNISLQLSLKVNDYGHVSNAYLELGYAYLSLEKKDSVEHIYTEAIKKWDELHLGETTDIAKCWKGLGDIHYKIKNNQEALKCYRKAVNIYDKAHANSIVNNINKYSDIFYIFCLRRLNELYLVNGDIKYLKSEFANLINVLSNDSCKLTNNSAKEIYYLCSSFIEFHNYEFAINLYDIASNHIKDDQLDSNTFYLFHTIFGDINMHKRNYDKALSIYEDCVNYYKTNPVGNTIEYQSNLSKIAIIQQGIGEFRSAIETSNQLNAIFQLDSSNANHLIINNLIRISLSFIATNNLKAADSTLSKAESSLKHINNFDINNIYCFFYLTKADLKIRLGDTMAAENALKIVKDITSRDMKSKVAFQLELWMGLSQLYAEKDKYDAAISCVQKIDSFYLNQQFPSYHARVNNYLRLANMSFEIKDPKLLRSSLDSLNRIWIDVFNQPSLMRNYYLECAYLSNIFGILIASNELEYARKFMTLLEESEDYLQKHPELYSAYLYNQILYSHQRDDRAKFINYYLKYENQGKISYLNNITYQSKRERNHFINQNRFFQNDLLSMIFSFNLSVLAFNVILQNKYLKLDDENAFSKLIRSSNDSVVLNTYKLMAGLTNEINYLKGTDILDNVAITNKYRYLDSLDKIMVLHLNHYENFKSRFEIRWTDVQNTLKSDEVAIEFTRYYDVEDTCYKYMAQVLRKGYEYPHLVKLCAEKDLPKTDLSTHLTQLYRLVWAPLESLLKGVKTVYYSPDGLLYSVPFHALCSNDSAGCTYLMDRYTLHRLSTTRYLADSTLVKTKELEGSIALFGGIQYDVIPDSTNTKKEETNEDFLLANNLKRESTRGAMSYLPGTKTEVEGVGQLFNSQKWTSSISTGTNATETAFKTISDSSSPSIIHIATHGFAFPDKAEKPKQRMGMMISTDREQQHYNAAEDPMLRCGLMFAGANLSWTGKQEEMLQKTGDDGILTAAEVAAMDLSNTKLVVLSACETGLGKIEGSEGVFGLQRGFKLAGVEQLIVSLWAVPDKETMQLMTAFYTDLALTKDPVISFAKAQQQMRNNNPDAPEKWAGFVLVR